MATVINDLTDLNSVNDADLVDTFTRNKSKIFQYALKDVADCLNPRDLETLFLLRNELCNDVKLSFAAYSQRTPINRRVKHLVTQDIYYLGYSLVKERSDQDLEKIFAKKDNLDPDDAKKDNLDPDDAVTGELQRDPDTIMPWRDLQGDVKALKTRVVELCSQNEMLLQLVRKQQTMLDAMEEQQNRTASLLKAVSGDVKKITTSMDIDECDSEVSFCDDDVDPSDVLLVGDSMIRDVSSTSEHLVCTSLSGARICDVRKHLRTIKPRKTKLKKIVMVCGTNDCNTRKTCENIVQEYEHAITMAKERASAVEISSILPRLDGKVDQTKIDTVNQLMLTQCNKLGVKFVNNDKNFKFQDNSVDETLLLTGDKLHLSSRGVTKLIQNLKLADVTKVTSKGGASWATLPMQSAWRNPLPVPQSPAPPPMKPVQSPDEATIKFRGGKSPFSNFYMTPIHAWNMDFKSVEHGYTYYKALAMDQPHLAEKILTSKSAKDAKDIADTLVTNQKWQQTKTSVMYYLLQQKARQCKRFHIDLKNSKNKLLVEDTNNEFWGRGLKGDGQNLLGRLLMTLRDKLPSYEGQHIHSLRYEHADTSTYSPPLPPRRANFSFTPQPKVAPRRHQQGRSYPRNRDEQQHCFNCGEKSHNLRSCRHPHPLQCYSCLGEGHKRKYCPFTTRDQSRAAKHY